VAPRTRTELFSTLIGSATLIIGFDVADLFDQGNKNDLILLKNPSSVFEALKNLNLFILAWLKS
jgi:hypothetical protein